MPSELSAPIIVVIVVLIFLVLGYRARITVLECEVDLLRKRLAEAQRGVRDGTETRSGPD